MTYKPPCSENITALYAFLGIPENPEGAETVKDVDAIFKALGINWDYAGATLGQAKAERAAARKAGKAAIKAATQPRHVPKAYGGDLDPYHKVTWQTEAKAVNAIRLQLPKHERHLLDAMLGHADAGTRPDDSQRRFLSAIYGRYRKGHYGGGQA